MTVCMCAHAGGEVGKRQRPPTLSAQALTSPPSPLWCQPPIPGPVVGCGFVNLLWQIWVWLEDNWNLAKKSDYWRKKWQLMAFTEGKHSRVVKK